MYTAFGWHFLCVIAAERQQRLVGVLRGVQVENLGFWFCFRGTSVGCRFFYSTFSVWRALTR